MRIQTLPSQRFQYFTINTTNLEIPNTLRIPECKYNDRKDQTIFTQTNFNWTVEIRW